MQKGLDRIGLGQVGWRILIKWFEGWTSRLLVVILGLLLMTFPIPRPLYSALVFVIFTYTVGAAYHFLDPWIRKSPFEEAQAALAAEIAAEYAALDAKLCEGMKADTDPASTEETESDEYPPPEPELKEEPRNF